MFIDGGHLFMDGGASIYRCWHLFIDAGASLYIYIYIYRCRDCSYIQQFLVCSVEFYKGVDGAPNHLGPGMGHICLGLSGAAAWGCLTLPGAT